MALALPRPRHRLHRSSVKPWLEKTVPKVIQAQQPRATVMVPQHLRLGGLSPTPLRPTEWESARLLRRSTRSRSQPPRPCPQGSGLTQSVGARLEGQWEHQPHATRGGLAATPTGAHTWGQQTDLPAGPGRSDAAHPGSPPPHRGLRPTHLESYAAPTGDSAGAPGCPPPMIHLEARQWPAHPAVHEPPAIFPLPADTPLQMPPVFSDPALWGVLRLTSQQAIDRQQSRPAEK